MKEMIKRQYKKAILVLTYIAMALLIYLVWFDAMWHLWYIDVITAVVIIALGLTIGYLWIKAEDKKALEEESKKEDVKTETVEPKSVENNQ